MPNAGRIHAFQVLHPCLSQVYWYNTVALLWSRHGSQKNSYRLTDSHSRNFLVHGLIWHLLYFDNVTTRKCLLYVVLGRGCSTARATAGAAVVRSRKLGQYLPRRTVRHRQERFALQRPKRRLERPGAAGFVVVVRWVIRMVLVVVVVRM